MRALVFGLYLAACSACGQAPVASHAQRDAMAALLDSLARLRPAAVLESSADIRDRIGPDGQYRGPELPAGYAKAVADLLTRYSAPTTLRGRVTLPTGMTWTDSLGHSREVLAVTGAGLSADGTTAAVYVARHCGPLCGGESLYLLRRQPDGRWLLEYQVPLLSS
jgi:hypothetical protein